MISALTASIPRRALGALALVLWVACLTPAARATAYWSPIHATVLAVDRRHHTVTIRHEALETAPAGVRVCVVHDSRALLHLKEGQLIEARAETSTSLWTLDAIRIVGRSGSTTDPRRMA
jgi:Cu/Ag efflux protein CusF